MLRVDASTMVRAPKDLVSETYADYRNWPRLFPTISGVRLLRHDEAKLVLEVDHVEGRVINELTLRLPDELHLWEESVDTTRVSSTASRLSQVARFSRLVR